MIIRERMISCQIVEQVFNLREEYISIFCVARPANEETVTVEFAFSGKIVVGVEVTRPPQGGHIKAWSDADPCEKGKLFQILQWHLLKSSPCCRWVKVSPGWESFKSLREWILDLPQQRAKLDHKSCYAKHIHWELETFAFAQLQHRWAIEWVSVQNIRNWCFNLTFFQYIGTRSLGALRAPTSVGGPLGLMSLSFAPHTLVSIWRSH